MTSVRASIAMAGTPTTWDSDEDVTSFDSWYRAEHPRLLAALTVACGDPHLAQDVTAEAFTRALAAWRRVGAMESPSGWTYRVAINLLRRRARRSASEARLLRTIVPPTPNQSPHDAVELWDAVDALPPRERLAVGLRYAAGLTEAEVAEAMYVAVGTASATLSSARRRLSSALYDGKEPDDG